MKIDNRFPEKDLSTTIAAYEETPDGIKPVEKETVLEHFLRIYVNGILTMQMVCSPSNLVPMTVGRLFDEGIIDSVDDIERIYICDQGERAQVVLNKAVEKKEDFVDTTPSCCTGNQIYAQMYRDNALLSPLPAVSWKPEWIYALAKRFSKEMPVYKVTRGVHSCFLAKEDQVLYACEDLGRHNALNKVIGQALIDGIDLSSCILYTSGRVPTDMAQKAIRAGIPVLVSKTVPTDLAIELAKEYRLTLIGQAKPEHFIVYHRP